MSNGVGNGNGVTSRTGNTRPIYRYYRLSATPLSAEWKLMSATLLPACRRPISSYVFVSLRERVYGVAAAARFKVYITPIQDDPAWRSVEMAVELSVSIAST